MKKVYVTAAYISSILYLFFWVWAMLMINFFIFNSAANLPKMAGVFGGIFVFFATFDVSDKFKKSNIAKQFLEIYKKDK